MIPKYGCDCESHFAEIEQRRPPDFSSRIAFRLWGIEVHDDVNQSLESLHFF